MMVLKPDDHYFALHLAHVWSKIAQYAQVRVLTNPATLPP